MGHSLSSSHRKRKRGSERRGGKKGRAKVAGDKRKGELCARLLEKRGRSGDGSGVICREKKNKNRK